ncbi:MAG: 2-phospho-L-lactate transferase [bacterium]|nr:2-phospho-L-lactate transferase [bacterium]
MRPPERPAPAVTVLAGGYGAARLLQGLVTVCDPASVTAVVNCGDDMVLGGLHISPDLDTVTYCLAGELNPETGWGLRDESWRARETLRRLGGPSWFALGDRDLGTHLYRTQRLAEGVPLSLVTAELTDRWGVAARLLPVTDDRLRTRVTIAGGAEDNGRGAGGEIGFQEYFVGLAHAVAVRSVRFAGAERARPAPGVLDDIAEADAVLIAPSNPIVSIGPLLALREVRRAVIGRREQTVAISPIVAGAALRGPAARLMAELGHEPSAVGVARIYAPVAGTLVIDEQDAALAPAVEAEGMRCVVAASIMHTPAHAATLGRAALEAAGRVEPARR